MNRSSTLMFAAAVASALMSTLALSPAHAGAAISAGQYYDGATRTCNGGTWCVNNMLSLVKPGQTVVITRVTCHIKVPKTAQIAMIQAGRQFNGNANVTHVQMTSAPAKMYEDGSSAYYQLNSEVNMTILPDHRPVIQIAFPAAVVQTTMLCSATGFLAN